MRIFIWMSRESQFKEPKQQQEEQRQQQQQQQQQEQGRK
jgi:hypothetical protein